MKILTVLLLSLLSFTSGYVLACTEEVLVGDPQSTSQPQKESVSAPFQQNPGDDKLSYEDEIKQERTVTIVFTLDEQNKIHVLHVSGGVNLVTKYIRNSLEGKEIHSENAVPGINYVMTIKLPASV
ncbi:MAG: hypothetical protein ACKVPJ_09125 [Chitinophagales bacterium]